MVTQPDPALPGGTLLGDYVVVRKIGGGGFSLVYQARDAAGESVAIKEFLPAAVASRAPDSARVEVGDPDNLRVFRHGMKCFFEEGRTLATIDHPNVVRVLNFFRANDTVYMVMRYERGKTLQQHIVAHAGQVREGFIRRVFAQLLNGLREVHTHKLLHLDIKPSNIYIRLDGSPVLIDFGAARQTLTRDESKLQPMYTPGFAAPEQYHSRERLGPWTDVYSLGASLYACLAGMPPPSAEERLAGDKLVAASTRWAGDYSAQLLETIDRCLKLNYLERPQSLHSLQKALLNPGIEAEPVAPLSALASIRRKLDRDIF